MVLYPSKYFALTVFARLMDAGKLLKAKITQISQKGAFAVNFIFIYKKLCDVIYVHANKEGKCNFRFTIFL